MPFLQCVWGCPCLCSLCPFCTVCGCPCCCSVPIRRGEPLSGPTAGVPLSRLCPRLPASYLPVRPGASCTAPVVSPSLQVPLKYVLDTSCSVEPSWCHDWTTVCSRGCLGHCVLSTGGRCPVPASAGTPVCLHMRLIWTVPGVVVRVSRHTACALMCVFARHEV